MPRIHSKSSVTWSQPSQTSQIRLHSSWINSSASIHRAITSQRPQMLSTYSKCVELIVVASFGYIHVQYSSQSLSSHCNITRTVSNSMWFVSIRPKFAFKLNRCLQTFASYIWDVITYPLSPQARLHVFQFDSNSPANASRPPASKPKLFQHRQTSS